MRSLTVLEMDAVYGGAEEDSFIQRFGQCTVDTLMGGAAGAAIGVATGGTAMVPLVIIGLIAGNLASDACNSL